MRAPALLVLLCASACTPDFAAPSDVTDLRILAAQAEPPEVQFDPADPVTPSVTVRVLAIDPRRPSVPIVVRAELCAPTDSRRCDSGPKYPVGDAALETTLRIPVDKVLDAALLDDLKGRGGIRVQYSFSVENGDPLGRVYGSKLLLFTPKGGVPNRNPLLTGVHLTRAAKVYGDIDPRPGDTLELPVGAEIGLRPLLSKDSREEYMTTDFRGNQVRLREQPRYSFFVTPGAEIGVESADEPLDGNAPPDGLSRITARAGSATAGTLWIVARDGRGGETWAAFPWSAVQPTPSSSRPSPVHDRPDRR